MPFRRLPAIVASIVVIVGGVAWFAAASPSRDSLRARTVSLTDGRRPFVFRLSGQDRWAPCPADSATNGTAIHCAGFALDDAGVTEATALGHDARESQDETPDDARRTLATIDLLAEPAAGAATASRRIETLESLVAADSGNAALRNDLAVAYFARGDAWSVFLGLDQMERAFATDSTSAVIAFNRAVALDEVHLSNEARAAWTAYARDHREKGWADEAARRLAAVEARLQPRLFDSRPAMLASETVRDPQHAREYVLDSLLPGWAAAVVAGDIAQADSACAAIAGMGALIAKKSGDRSVSGIASDCASRKRQIADATLRLATGNDQFRRGSFVRAGRSLGDAGRRLRAMGAASIAGWSDVTNGFVEIYAGDYRAADSTFIAVERAAAARGDSALVARALWGQGLSAARHGAPAVQHYSRAADIYRRLDEPLNRASMVSQTGDPLLLLGRDEAGLRAKREALALFDIRLDARPRPGPPTAFGVGLVDLGLPDAAAAVLREALALTARSERPNERPEALIQLGSAEIAAGRAERGRAHIMEAMAAFPTIRDTLMFERQEMAASLALASLDVTRAPDTAIARLTAVESYYRRTNLQYNRALPLARRGRARLRIGDTVAARRDIAAAVEAIEAQGVTTTDPIATRDRAAAQREVFETLVGLEAARGDTIAAFAAAERARGNLASAVPKVDADRVMLSYFSLSDRLLLWVSSAQGTRLVTIPVGAAALSERVRAVESLLRRGEDDAEWRAASRSLYDLVVGPAIDARTEDGSAGRVTVVPDAALGRLPFAALVDPSGRYFGERAVVTYAPATRSRVDVPLSRATAVVVGEPTPDLRTFPDLGRLPGASREVAAVRTAYPGATVILDSAATKATVMRAMSRATLFHFAGHARLVERVPSQSHLVLAPSAPREIEGSILTAAEIARMDLRRLGLAILSSCGTTQARSRRDAGESGLSEAFFAAGARAVISSRWPVDDDGTAALMEDLHAELARGTPAAVALSRAQAKVMHSTTVRRPLSVWSAFVYEER